MVWQDHFLKERNMRVPIMRRSRRNMEYYIGKDLEGCFVAVDGRKTVGSIISHSWGAMGWFGPLEVNPVCQGKGYGRALVARSVEYLRSRGCTTIGCETMAGSPYNIAFYRKMGFRAASLSYVLFKRLAPPAPESVTPVHARALDPAKDMGKCREMWNRILPGLDYSVELASVGEKELGHVWVMDTPSGPAHAIVHTYEMFEDSQNAIIKLLVAGKEDGEMAGALLDRCETSAAMLGKTGMFLRTYDASPPDLNWFFRQGYELQGTSVRLILEGPDESDEMLHVSCWSG
jgi:GNAT superfamily N-acetyltransferase